MKTKNVTLCALSAAIICVFSVLSFPIGSIPITLGLFAVILCGCILPAKSGVISVVIYILLGLTGLPVFSGFRSGIHVLAGPTGGYIISYIAIAPLSNLIFRFAEKKKNAVKYFTYLTCSLPLLLICYSVAVMHFSLIMNCGIRQSLAECVIPFVIFDIIKTIGALLIADSINKKIKFKG